MFIQIIPLRIISWQDISSKVESIAAKVDDTRIHLIVITVFIRSFVYELYDVFHKG